MRDPLGFPLEGQHSHRDLGREVFLGDGQLTALPQLADEPDAGAIRRSSISGEAQARVHRLPHRDLGRRLVAGQQRVSVGIGQLDDLRFWRLGRIVFTTSEPCSFPPPTILLSCGPFDGVVGAARRQVSRHVTCGGDERVDDARGRGRRSDRGSRARTRRRVSCGSPRTATILTPAGTTSARPARSS